MKLKNLLIIHYIPRPTNVIRGIVGRRLYHMKYLMFFIILFYSFNLKSQTDTNNHHNKICCDNFGIEIRASYNYKISHFSAVLDFSVNKHNFYLGPEYSKILINPLFGDPIDKFEISPLGLNFGYYYIFGKKEKRLSGFAQLNYSVYKNTIIELQLGPYKNIHKSIVFENTFSVGMIFKTLKNTNLHCSIGLGSYKGFFLILDEFFPSASIGFEYKL